jgi:class 3 adenylate cyclase
MSTDPAQRRLAAILAADVVGYSQLMGQDEVGTLAALKSARVELIDPKVAEHSGRVFKTTGDGLLAEFPSVVNAVACAVDIQRCMIQRYCDVQDGRHIQLRIGINVLPRTWKAVRSLPRKNGQRSRLNSSVLRTGWKRLYGQILRSSGSGLRG